MTLIEITQELKTTSERVWAIYFDRDFNQQLRDVMRTDDFQEELFNETENNIYIKYHIVVKRTLPDWVKKVLGDVKVGFRSEDTFDKKTLTLVSKITPDVLPSKIKISGIWRVEPSPNNPLWSIRTFRGDLQIDIPLIGRKMEERLSDAVKEDFAFGNKLLDDWAMRDFLALSEGKALPNLIKPGPVQLK